MINVAGADQTVDLTEGIAVPKIRGRLKGNCKAILRPIALFENPNAKGVLHGSQEDFDAGR